MADGASSGTPRPRRLYSSAVLFFQYSCSRLAFLGMALGAIPLSPGDPRPAAEAGGRGREVMAACRPSSPPCPAALGGRRNIAGPSWRDDPAAGIVGWANQGENDMRALPTGRQVLGGVPFLIAAPRSAVVLNSVNSNNLDLPREVHGIRVGRRADALFFLHTIAWDAGTAEPFRYRVPIRPDGPRRNESFIGGVGRF